MTHPKFLYRLCFVFPVLLCFGVTAPVAGQTGDEEAADSTVNQVDESTYYVLGRLPVPEDIALEVGGMTLLPDDRLAVATRRGDIWIIENPYMAGEARPRYERFAQGLHEPLGLAYTNGVFYANQRGELTRIVDTDGDERADQYRAVSTWELSGNYHEYSYGPMILPGGDLFVTLNLAWIGQGASLAEWSGWALRVTPDGNVTPMAAGMRSPAGFGMNAEGDIFYSDNQGGWVGSGRISHVERGDFLGNPEGLRWTNDPASPLKLTPDDIPDTGRPLHAVARRVPELKEPALWLPHGIMGISTSDILIDSTGGAFGPFAGQMFIGDQGQSKVMRAFLEKVDGQYQGAVFPFREGLHSGVVRLAWGNYGSMFVGMTSRGWAATGADAYGIDRLIWTGKVPMEIEEMRATADGFELEFTRPVAPGAARNLANYRMTGFTYKYHSEYGSPVIDEKTCAIRAARVLEDGRTVRLAVDSLREGYIHELKITDLASRGGVPLLHGTAYYTLNRIPEGTPMTTVDTATAGSPDENTAPASAEQPTRAAKHQADVPPSWSGDPERTITIGTEPGLRYDRTSFQVRAGTRVKLVFTNDDDMLHNLLVVRPGTAESVARAAANLGLQGQEMGYVPPTNDVLFYTDLLQPETSEAIYFTAPERPGDYTYVCTFPGHWRTMQGVMRVVAP